MSMQEAGKAVGSFFDIMKQQSLPLALVVVVFLQGALLWSVFGKADEARESQMKMIFDLQAQTQVLLSKCVVPGP